MITDISPKQAWQKCLDNKKIILLDVRTIMEFAYIGHPTGAIHVPLMEAPAWQIEPAFVQNVRDALADYDSPQDLTILVLCRSGKRSQIAAELLEAAGFKSLFNIVEGFEGDLNDKKQRSTINGWKFHQLPWEQN